jgi:hypothetical protein
MAERVEPWLRGTLTEVDALRRQVLHALELALEDGEQYCAGLSDAEMAARPSGIAPVSFHLRHIVRSLDRLLTYAEGKQLSAERLAELRTELDARATTEAVMAEFRAGIAGASARVRAVVSTTYEDMRGVGRERLPSTVGGLLVHCAEHTQRHIGQAITTAKVVRANYAGTLGE